MTKWSVQVSDETDKAVKAFLAEQGGEFIPHDEAMRQMEDKIQTRLKP